MGQVGGRSKKEGTYIHIYIYVRNGFTFLYSRN